MLLHNSPINSVVSKFQESKHNRYVGQVRGTWPSILRSVTSHGNWKMVRDIMTAWHRDIIMTLLWHHIEMERWLRSKIFSSSSWAWSLATAPASTWKNIRLAIGIISFKLSLRFQLDSAVAVGYVAWNISDGTMVHIRSIIQWYLSDPMDDPLWITCCCNKKRQACKISWQMISKSKIFHQIFLPWQRVSRCSAREDRHALPPAPPPWTPFRVSELSYSRPIVRGPFSSFAW